PDRAFRPCPRRETRFARATSAPARAAIPRAVSASPCLQDRYLHGAFFLGSKSFYHWLRDLNGEDFEGLSMTKVSKVNDLYDEHELAIRRQRKNARFFNSCMQMSLLGEASSDTRADGGVVSGVGGQYNFVAMSHELPDARSILMLKSTRTVKGKRVSNIVWSPPHLTIPRHLRDIVVTEYGIADLRGQSDEICIQRVLMITDAEFQEELLQTAKSNKKVSKDWQLPDSAKNNTAVNVNLLMQQFHFPRFPFGSDFTPEEEVLQSALMALKEQNIFGLLKTLLRGNTLSDHMFEIELGRMGLKETKSFKDLIFKKVLLGALFNTDRTSKVRQPKN
ncbi:MAG: acetyl-CoA hydrolase/transferase C-terminal domain-containing protein, partial [Bdellovibrio sp.]